MDKKNVFYYCFNRRCFLFLSIFYGGNNSQTLVASGHTDWAPIMYQEGNKIIGAGPEIITKIFDELGIKVNSKYVGSWDVVQEKAKDGSIDVIVAAYKTTEREAYMDYSIPYTIDPVVLVVKKGNDFAYEDWEDLVGKKGIVMTGDSYGQAFDNILLTDKLTVEEVGTPEEAFSLWKRRSRLFCLCPLFS